MKGITGSSLQGRIYIKKENPIRCDCSNCGHVRLNGCRDNGKKRFGDKTYIYCNHYCEWKIVTQCKDKKKYCRFYYKTGTL